MPRQLGTLVGPTPLAGHNILHLVDDSLLIPGIDIVSALLALVLDKDQFLGHGSVVLLPGDIALLHLCTHLSRGPPPSRGK